MEIPIPVHSVKENIWLSLSSVECLFCMIAGAIPKSLKILKNEMMTVAIATTPNSSGSISRASTPATAKEMMIPEYFDIAV